MSLYQRANSFNKKSKDIYQGSLNPSNAVQIEKADKGSSFTKQELLSKLNDQVQKVISADKLAKIVAKSPIVAKAEIKSAAQYCYMLDFWKEVDEKIKQDLIEALIHMIHKHSAPLWFHLDCQVHAYHPKSPLPDLTIENYAQSQERSGLYGCDSHAADEGW